ncbi:hypothetical protein ACNKHR_18235 [Shigella flexneri]
MLQLALTQTKNPRRIRQI